MGLADEPSKGQITLEQPAFCFIVIAAAFSLAIATGWFQSFLQQLREGF
jgi:hypothetical protein